MEPTDERGNLFLFPIHTAGGQEIESDVEWRDVSHLHSLQAVEPTVAVDFETYYSSKYKMGYPNGLPTWEYVHHTAFDAYLVSLEYFDGERWWRWVGHPKKAPWSLLHGITWLSHNAGFDNLVYLRLQELEICPKDVSPKVWHCTADFTTFLQAGRNLQLAVENLFKVKISKEVRDKMKTQSASSEEMRDYAADDSFWCARIWTHYGHKWPQQEREISSMVRHHGYRGIAIPVEKIKENIAKLEGVKNEIRSQLPWGHKGVVSSLKLFSMACAFKGISAPLSLSQDSDSARHWESQYGEKYPWIQLIRKFTKANQVQSSLQLMLHRCREDGTVPFSLGYCKATHTKRFQHQEGLRIQNLDKDPVEGIHLRHMLVPRPGHVFIIADLSQIEPRVLALRAGDQPFLEACRKGQSPYEVHARTTMGYTDPRPLKEADPQTYALAKARLLALGYQTGPEQFVEMAYTMARLEIQLDEPTVLVDGLNLPMSEFQRIIRDQGHPNFKQWISSYRDGTLPILPSAKNAVYDFRESATYTTKLWKRRMNEVCACEGSHYTLPLENGSSLRYFDVEVKRSQKTSRSGRTYTSREVKAWVIRNSRNLKDQKYLYEGKIVENEVQWIAREVFVYLFHKVCQIPDVNGVFSVHDEGIWEVPEHLAETRLDDILRTLHQAPPWAPDLPVAAEGEISLHYKK